jgi:parvulin-like peptidyl-prolyl isomerase
LVKKKSTKKTKNNFFKQYQFQLIAGGLALAIIAVLAFSLTANSSYVLKVNGEKISVDEYNNRMAFMQVMGAQATQEQVLEELVTEKLLLQEAKRRNVEVSRAEANEEYRTILELNGLTEDGLREQLASNGVSLEYFQDYFRRNLIISKLVDSVVEGTVVSDEEINFFYVQNLAEFVEPRRVVVRHILIDGSEEGYEQKATDVRSQINADASNFCNLVSEFTSDLASAATCGEYTYGLNDPFVEEFRDAGFDMSVGEIRNVKTTFGIHIMLKVEELESRDIPLEEAREDIRAYLSQANAQGSFEELLDSLRASATIVNS